MNNHIKFVIVTFSFVCIYFALWLLWGLPSTFSISYWFLFKSIFPLYVVFLNWFAPFNLPRKFLPLAKIVLVAILLTVMIYNIPYIQNEPWKATYLLGIYQYFYIIIYSATALFLIYILEAKIDSPLTIFSLTICLIGFVSEAWELPHHLINFIERPRPFLAVLRYVETISLRLILFIPLIFYGRKHGFAKNKLFICAIFFSIFVIPLWFVTDYMPLLRLIRIPYTLMAVGYALGIKT